MAGGWGNLGGGFTFVIMITLYNALVSGGLSLHVAWRAAFVIVPVPFLLIVAAAVLTFGTDHPAGKWSDRQKAVRRDVSTPDYNKTDLEKKESPVDVQVTLVESATDQSACHHQIRNMMLRFWIEMVSELDSAVSEPLTLRLALSILSKPVTWLPAFTYFTTLGYELAMNANLANVLLALYQSSTFGQTKAGYVCSGRTFHFFADPIF